jgi:hypothetical protein
MLARQIAVGFRVAVIFPLLIYYGVSTLSPAPKWNDFQAPATYTTNMSAEERIALQDKQKADNLAYAAAERTFSLRLLCVAVPLGYAAILFGSGRAASGLRVGLMFGGIFAVSTGYWSHWSFIADWLRFVSLLIAMAVLVFVGYRHVPSVSHTTAK